MANQKDRKVGVYGRKSEGNHSQYYCYFDRSKRASNNSPQIEFSWPNNCRCAQNCHQLCLNCNPRSHTKDQHCEAHIGCIKIVFAARCGAVRRGAARWGAFYRAVLRRAASSVKRPENDHRRRTPTSLWSDNSSHVMEHQLKRSKVH